MIFTDSVNHSYTMTFPAAEDISALTAVKLTSDGLKTCAAGEIAFGISMQDYAAGTDATVVVRGGRLWKVLEKVTTGDFLSVDAGGLAKRVVADDFIFAQALSDANPGEAAQVLIIRFGLATGSENSPAVDDEI